MSPAAIVGALFIAALSRVRMVSRPAASRSLKICSAAASWSFACRTTSSHDRRLERESHWGFQMCTTRAFAAGLRQP